MAEAVTSDETASQRPSRPSDAPSTSADGRQSDVERVAQLAAARDAIIAQVKRRIVGQDEVIELLLIALFAKGHGLFVGVPGLAKTTLISALGDTLSLDSNRIQFTPDLMPSDITGTDVLEEDPETGKRRFRFVRGPVFTHILLADEINRTPPKTQAALLQSMAEAQVTAGGQTYALEEPYLVFATQNPIEQEGTYPLPEAQLDRFMFQINVPYPSEDDELEIVRRTTAAHQVKTEVVLTRPDFLELQALVPKIPIADHVARLAVSIARASRPGSDGAPSEVKEYVSFGAGPRASQALVLGAKARAALHGRFAAEREDILAVAPAVLRHRLVLSYRAHANGTAVDDLVASILERQ